MVETLVLYFRLLIVSKLAALKLKNSALSAFKQFQFQRFASLRND